MTRQQQEAWAELVIGAAKDQRDADLLEQLSDQAKLTLLHFLYYTGMTPE